MNLDNYQAVAMSLFFLYLQQYMYLSDYREKFAVRWLWIAVLLLLIAFSYPFLAAYVAIPGWICMISSWARIICLLLSMGIFVRFARRR